MKELDRELQKKLESEEKKIKLKENREKHENKYLNAAIMFFGTLFPLYFFYFGAIYIFMFFFRPVLYLFQSSLYLFQLYLGWIFPLIHGAIWVAAVISVYRKKSVLEDIIHRF